MNKFDVTIIGGGVPGMALAALLAPSGLRILLADAGGPVPALKDVKPDGRTAALMGGSVDVLAKARVWPLLKTHGAPLKRMAVVDDSRFPASPDTMIEQAFSADELGQEAFGWNLPLTAIRAALAEKLKKFKNVTFFTGVSFNNFKVKDSIVKVTLQNKIYETALLVGCDGRDSPVREQSGITTKRRAYGQTAITCLISHTKSHNDTSTEFHRPGGPFTIVPMPDKNMSAIVWVEKENDGGVFLKLPRASFITALSDRTRGRIGKIDLVSNPASWPLEYLRAHKLTAPRVALAAEAAHVISPIGAQGLNLSLRDAATLAHIISEAHALGLDTGSPTVLAKYERARKNDVISRSFTIDLANQAVASDTNAVHGLRRLVLRALSLPGPWRQIVMKKGLAA